MARGLVRCLSKEEEGWGNVCTCITSSHHRGTHHRGTHHRGTHHRSSHHGWRIARGAVSIGLCRGTVAVGRRIAHEKGRK